MHFESGISTHEIVMDRPLDARWRVALSHALKIDVRAEHHVELRLLRARSHDMGWNYSTQRR